MRDFLSYLTPYDAFGPGRGVADRGDTEVFVAFLAETLTTWTVRFKAWGILLTDMLVYTDTTTLHDK